MNEIRVGQIWIVINDFWSSVKGHKVNGRNTRIEIKKDELIEVRYPYAWHLRTEIDDVYFHVDKDTLLKSCLLYGVIYDKTKSQNKLKLSEIIEQEQFTFINTINF